jgi:hypothetical protein
LIECITKPTITAPKANTPAATPEHHGVAVHRGVDGDLRAVAYAAPAASSCSHATHAVRGARVSHFGQFEPSLGVIPGGGAAQHLTRLMGRARALEVMLSAEDYAADLAERYGWINRALPADALDDFVSSLARRIASFPAAGRAVVKEASQRDCARSHRGLPPRFRPVRRGSR